MIGAFRDLGGATEGVREIILPLRHLSVTFRTYVYTLSRVTLKSSRIMQTSEFTDVSSTVHFISGLPRSGSTLLSAILRQNPRFSAGVTSPLLSLCTALHQKMANTEFSVFFDEPRRASMLRGLFQTYYAHLPRDCVIFDTNRSWTGRVPLLASLYPKSRIICCVREIGWILDSIEGLWARTMRCSFPKCSRCTRARPYTRAPIR